MVRRFTSSVSTGTINSSRPKWNSQVALTSTFANLNNSSSDQADSYIIRKGDGLSLFSVLGREQLWERQFVQFIRFDIRLMQRVQFPQKITNSHNYGWKIVWHPKNHIDNARPDDKLEPGTILGAEQIREQWRNRKRGLLGGETQDSNKNDETF